MVDTITVRAADARDVLPDLGRRTLVMGILNITPDSFSDGGRYLDVDDALRRAVEMEEVGADVIDVGAESTRPGHQPLSLDDEWERLEPVMRRLPEVVTLPISVDTYKAEIARRALELGAAIVNDVWGGRRDPAMYSVVAGHRAPYVLMHNSSDRSLPAVAGIAQLVRDELLDAARAAEHAGVPAGLIILDPGIGFGKTHGQNLALVNDVGVLKDTGYPVLVGTSRKSFIGTSLGLPVDRRVEGTAATVAIAIARGVDIVRVHDVAEMARVAKMTDALVR